MNCLMPAASSLVSFHLQKTLIIQSWMLSLQSNYLVTFFFSQLKFSPFGKCNFDMETTKFSLPNMFLETSRLLKVLYVLYIVYIYTFQILHLNKYKYSSIGKFRLVYLESLHVLHKGIKSDPCTNLKTFLCLHTNFKFLTFLLTFCVNC